MATFSMIRDISGLNSFGLSFADKGDRTTLAQGVAQTFTAPSNPDATYSKWLATFTYESGTTVWVANNAAATLPGNSPDGSTCEMNPVSRKIKPGDVISLITPNTSAEVGVRYDAIQ